LYTGDDTTAVDFILVGGHGGISVTMLHLSNCTMFYELALAGDGKLMHWMLHYKLSTRDLL